MRRGSTNDPPPRYTPPSETVSLDMLRLNVTVDDWAIAAESIRLSPRNERNLFIVYVN